MTKDEAQRRRWTFCEAVKLEITLPGCVDDVMFDPGRYHYGRSVLEGVLPAVKNSFPLARFDPQELVWLTQVQDSGNVAEALIGSKQYCTELYRKSQVERIINGQIMLSGHVEGSRLYGPVREKSDRH